MVGQNDAKASDRDITMQQLKIIIGLMLFSVTGFANTSAIRTIPNAEEAAYKAALSQSWQPNKMDRATSSFEAFLKKYPDHKEAWIAYANLESWKQNFRKAFALLERYRTRFGSTPEYLSAHARILASAGHYNQAIALNTPLANQNPDDYDLVYTHATALYKANRFKEARVALQKLKKIQPNNNDTLELEHTFHTLVESMLSSGLNYYQDNQTIKNWTIPLSFDWALNDNTHFIFRGLHELLTAGKHSGSETVQGKSSITDNSVMAGIKWRIVPNIAVIGMVGDLKIEGLPHKFIYWVDANVLVAENAALELFHLRNLYRPYLYPTSPKAVSLGIVEELNGLKIVSQPFIQTNVNLLVSYSTLSDGNHYAHLNFSPTQQFILNSHWGLIVGTDVEFLFFDKQLNHGYYNPKSHQEYLATAGLNYNPITYFNCSLSMGTGIHQDQTTDGFRPASHAYASAAYTFSPWEFGLSYDYTYQGAAHDSQSYQGFSVEARLAIHF